jgi:hypothetical protein
MKGLWGLVIAAISYVILSTGYAHGEVWSCAISNGPESADVQQYRLDGNVLKDLTDDKIWHEILRETDNSKFLGFQYNVLLNDKFAIIAELDSTETKGNKPRQIYVVNIIIDKVTGNLINTSILSHLPEPTKIDTRYGSCTVDK